MTKKTQSIAGLVRSRLDEYLRRKKYGERHIVFYNELLAEGYEIKSLDVFNNCLDRARADAAKNKALAPTIKNSDDVNQNKQSLVVEKAVENKKVIMQPERKTVVSQSDITAMLNDQDFDASKL